MAAGMPTRILLSQGDVAGAIRWAEASGVSSSDIDLSYPREREYLTLARVRIARGRADPAGPSLPAALHLLARLLENAEAQGRMGHALERLILQALALHIKGERERRLPRSNAPSRSRNHKATRAFLLMKGCPCKPYCDRLRRVA